MKKGFTLVELLAVIVILAVILVIAVPQISNVIKETKKNSLGSTAKVIAAKAEEATVENEILGNDGRLTCDSLVKLDDNYGNCNVSVTNGVGNVTLEGAGKFAGFSCTGTKSSMNCSEGTLEYVYSFNEPYYDYTYTVTDSEACIPYLQSYFQNITGYTQSSATTEATNICNGTDQYISTSEWFRSYIQSGLIPESDVSEFIERSGPGTLMNVVSDYTSLTYEYAVGEQATPKVFIRWDADETEFRNSSRKDICTLYANELTCFDDSSSYSTIANTMSDLFGNVLCTEETLNGGLTNTNCDANPWWCGVSTYNTNGGDLDISCEGVTEIDSTTFLSSHCEIDNIGGSYTCYGTEIVAGE